MESGRDRTVGIEKGQVQNQVHQAVALAAVVSLKNIGEREVTVVQVQRTRRKDEANELNSHRHQQKNLAAGKIDTVKAECNLLRI